MEPVFYSEAQKLSAYALKARFDSLSMADSRKTYTLGSLDIDMASDLKKTTLDVKTGD